MFGEQFKRKKRKKTLIREQVEITNQKRKMNQEKASYFEPGLRGWDRTVSCLGQRQTCLCKVDSCRMTKRNGKPGSDVGLHEPGFRVRIITSKKITMPQ